MASAQINCQKSVEITMNRTKQSGKNLVHHCRKTFERCPAQVYPPRPLPDNFYRRVYTVVDKHFNAQKKRYYVKTFSTYADAKTFGKLKKS